MFQKPDSQLRAWRKSTRSGGNGCVEVSLDHRTVGVRDSKDLGGPAFFVDASAWRSFVREVNAGKLSATASDA